MNRDKQTYLKFKPFADDLRKAEVWCELDGVLNRNKTVQNLYKMGYRKSTDLAEEIFAEIEEIAKIYTFPTVKNGIVEIVKEPFWCIEPNDLAELKKKYTEGK